jgi:hypothetical protein
MDTLGVHEIHEGPPPWREIFEALLARLGVAEALALLGRTSFF